LISVVQFGTVDYALCLRLQQQLVTLRKEEKIGDVLLLLEHKPVITLGRNAKAANVIASPELLAQRGVELFECDRGGDVTFHGPGQIVGYPIFDLRGFSRSSGHSQSLSSRAEEKDHVGTAALDSLSRAQPRDPVERSSTARHHLGAVDFVRRFEDVLMRTCADFGIPTKRIPGLTGVWTDASSLSYRAEANDSKNRSPKSRDLGFSRGTREPDSRSLDCEEQSASGSSRDDKNRVGHDFSRANRRTNNDAASAADVEEAKLAAIGIHISRFVTSHGFALNVNTDLSYFDLIVPCGITSKPVTSMQQELGRELDLNDVAQSISRNFGVVFGSQMLWVDTLDALLGRTVGVPMQAPKEFRYLHSDDTFRV
jgi:lipoate-protein ligase B